MGRIFQIGLDIAKEIFQVHELDEHVKEVLVKKLKRNRMLEFLQIRFHAWLKLKPAMELIIELVK